MVLKHNFYFYFLQIFSQIFFLCRKSRGDSARYQKNKEKIQRKSREEWINLSEEEKNKKREYGSKVYTNLSEDEKQKLIEYRKRYYEIQKTKNLL